MQVIQRALEYSRPDRIDVIPFGDSHFGSIHAAEDAACEQRDIILKNKNTYWVGMGDWADCITKDDKRFDMGGLASWVKKDDIVESQRKRIVEFLKPIAPKCLAYLTGNHEETIHKAHQHDITRHIVDDLNVPYGGYSCFLNLNFRRCNKSEWNLLIHAWHGAGAAQTAGARLNRLLSLVNDVQADVYFMGHLHAMTHHTPDRLVLENGKIKSLTLEATITGSWVKAYTQPMTPDDESIGYPEMKGYKPSRIGAPVLHIWPDERKFTIEG